MFARFSLRFQLRTPLSQGRGVTLISCSFPIKVFLFYLSSMSNTPILVTSPITCSRPFSRTFSSQFVSHVFGFILCLTSPSFFFPPRFWSLYWLPPVTSLLPSFLMLNLWAGCCLPPPFTPPSRLARSWGGFFKHPSPTLADWTSIVFFL